MSLYTFSSLLLSFSLSLSLSISVVILFYPITLSFCICVFCFGFYLLYIYKFHIVFVFIRNIVERHRNTISLLLSLSLSLLATYLIWFVSSRRIVVINRFLTTSPSCSASPVCILHRVSLFYASFSNRSLSLSLSLKWQHIFACFVRIG